MITTGFKSITGVEIVINHNHFIYTDILVHIYKTTWLSHDGVRETVRLGKHLNTP